LEHCNLHAEETRMIKKYNEPKRTKKTKQEPLTSAQ